MLFFLQLFLSIITEVVLHKCTAFIGYEYVEIHK